MYVPEKMRLNDFIHVETPKPALIFGRGVLPDPSLLQYSGDEECPMPANKIDQIESLQAYDRVMYREWLSQQEKAASESESK